MSIMIFQLARSFIIAVLFIIGCACTGGEAQKSNGTNQSANTAATPPGTVESKAVAAPAKSFTPADVAKLKWIEGTWRGMDGDKPFYERYKVEGSTMIVEGLKEDGAPEGEPGRFELKDGEFGQGEGDKRSAASEITADYVQFVPAVPGKGNSFRFHRQPDGTWQALLEWVGADKKPQQKIYKMERWAPKGKQ